MLVMVLVFGMSVVGVACAQPSSGTFTVTNIPAEYNGKYAFIEGAGDYSVADDSYLDDFISYNAETNTKTGTRITNGSVSIRIRSSGNHTVSFIEIGIYSSANGDSDDCIGELEFEDVVFTNGNATKSWNEGEFYDE